MNFINRKNPKDMTDDELLAEFRQAQRAAKARGQHLPLTVTRADPVNPTIHRPTVEEEIETFRKQRVAQNTAADVTKGIGRANRIRSPIKSLLDSVVTGFEITNMAEQRNLNKARELGEQGALRERLIKAFNGNITPEIERAFQEGLKRSNKQNR